MSYPREALDRAAWEAAILKISQSGEEVVPPGWINYEMFARKMGFCSEVAAQKLRLMARRGICERRDFKVKWGAAIRKRPYFRLKK